MHAAAVVGALLARSLVGMSGAAAAVGSPDPGFGTRGVAFGPQVYYQTAFGGVVQADGRIVVSYNGFDAAEPDHGHLTRFLADGRVDPSYTPLSSSVGLVASAPALDSAGRLLVGVQTKGDGDAVDRLLSDGAPDPAFGTDGLAPVALDRMSSALAVDASDRVVVAGISGVQAQLVRLDDAGQLDPTFGGTGRVTIGSYAGATSDTGLETQLLGVDAMGRIVVTSGSQVVRYLPSGTPDPSFGPGGAVALPGVPSALLVEPDGTITASVSDSATPPTVTLAQVRPDGAVALDVPLAVCGRAPDVRSITRLPDGDLLLSASGLLLVDVRPDGTLNPQFGSGGTALTDVADVSGDYSGGYAPANSVLTPDGAVVTVGTDVHVSPLRPYPIYGPVTLVRTLLTAGGEGAAPVGPIPGCGYWLAAADGTVSAFGDTASLGGHGPLPVAAPVVGITATPDGAGYWLVARDGGIFSFGDATFFGSTGAMRLNQPIVGMAATPDGGGYWLVAADGGIFSFGDATFFGSTGAMRLNQPIVGIASIPTGTGYWLVARDGGVFSFGGAIYYGSTGSLSLRSPIVGAAPVGGRGYEFVAGDGGVFTFGRASFWGSLGGLAPPPAVVGMASR